MGKQLIKISRDRDLYMEWSSMVEAPTFIGTRAELAAYLVEDFKEGTERHAREVDQTELRLLRADQIGSSAHPPWGCTWADSDGEIYQQQGYLPRARCRHGTGTGCHRTQSWSVTRRSGTTRSRSGDGSPATTRCSRTSPKLSPVVCTL